MKINLDCPEAYTGKQMRVYCRKLNGLCVHQYFKRCKGWWVNSPAAQECTLTKGEKNGTA